MLDEALELWRGPAYAEFADEDFARAEAARLEELRATAEEDRVEAALLLGRADEAVARLEALVADHPLRERPHAQLMLALYRNARQVDALAVYRRYRERLDEDLGLEPSPALQQLEARVLQQDPALDHVPADPASGGPAPASEPAGPSDDEPGTPPASAGNVPVAPQRLIGRDDDLRGIADSLRSARVVTLTGPGGVGKTSLALHAAAAAREDGRFPDGVWLVELASVTAPEAVADAVTTVLSVQQRHGRTVVERLVEYLRPKGLLLALDNCEHVIETAAALVDAVARGCPRVVVLATSREPLGVGIEHVRPVPPLRVPPLGSVDAAAVARSAAAALFEERATAASPDFALSDGNAAAVADLCRRLDGVPLAIELAASRMRSMNAAEVVERLSSRFRFLRSSRRIVAERHRTLRAVVDWSYGLLDPAERRLLDRLSVFAGAFSVRAAAAAAGDESDGLGGLDDADVADLVGGLVDKSMVVAVPGDGGTPGSSRYTLLETLRAYGQERLAEAGETDRFRRAHARYHVHLVESAAAGLRTPDPARWADAITRALDDLRAAHAWALDGDSDAAVRLVAGLADYAELRLPPEVFTWGERTVAAAESAGWRHPLLPVAYGVAAGGARFSGDLDRATALADAGLALLPDPADPLRRYPLSVLAEAALFRGRLEECAAAAAAAEDLALAAGDPLLSTNGALLGALVRAYSGDAAGALQLVERTRDRADRTAHPVAMAWARYVEGEIRMDDDPDRAGVLLDEALSRAAVVGDRYLTGVALVSAASLCVRHGDPDRARVLFRQVIEHWHQAGNRTQQWTTLRNVVELLVRLRADAPAAVLHGAVTSRANAAPAFGADAQRLDDARHVLIGRLGPEAFAAAAARGVALDDDGVVAGACAALDDAANPRSPVPAVTDQRAHVRPKRFEGCRPRGGTPCSDAPRTSPRC